MPYSKPQTAAVVLLLACSFGASGGAEVSHGAEPQDIAFTSNLDHTEQRYVELVPPEFNAQSPCDVVIALHGHGADRWQFIRDPRGECQGVRDVAMRRGAILISPDYRAATSWMGPQAEADVVQIIADLKRRHAVDRIFLVGGSMGGTAALIFATLHPELIAGTCSLNGTANMVEYDQFQDAIRSAYGGTKSEVPDEYRKRSPELGLDRLTMPVALTTGGKDTVVPPHSTRRLADKLAQGQRRVLQLHREEGGHATTYEDTCTALEFVLNEADLGAVQRNSLGKAAADLQTRISQLDHPSADLRADVAVLHKAIEWALRYEDPLKPADAELIHRALRRGADRADELRANAPSWTRTHGRVMRGFFSEVDGSIQPYGVLVPQNYDASKPVRLDVVLHGSSKPVGMSELRFLMRFDENRGDTESNRIDYIELHPLGRVENCYRWAGETDVFEAIEAVCRNYRIDRDRIVLRGMSMGASGTWHLGLKHPDRFVALGPYCGYVDTHKFSETPIPGFVKVGALPEYQEQGLHMLDSIDYAANVGMVPTIAAMGEKDVFFQAHVLMRDALAREGLPMVNLISPGTGHVLDPVTHREQLNLIQQPVRNGRPHDPRRLRFVTWTLKYHRCHWLEVLKLGQHYARAEVQAAVEDQDRVVITKTQNVMQFAVHRPLSTIRIDGHEIPLPAHESGDALAFRRVGAEWTCDGPRSRVPLRGKRPHLQGPIDDAFTGPFLCVRGTSAPWNVAVHDWAEASLRRFEYEWARYMRGDLPVKADVDVTPADVRDKHLILFGDPGSNRWIENVLPHLPLEWNRRELRIAHQTATAHDHAPVLICPNPLAENRYVVINSGHTFHAEEFAAFNYLLFPRRGDWATIKVTSGARDWQPASATFPEEVVEAGYFDESWQGSTGH